MMDPHLRFRSPSISPIAPKVRPERKRAGSAVAKQLRRLVDEHLVDQVLFEQRTTQN